MFKIESYLTPYISAYLAKYVKDFSTETFQVSFWQGDAVFHDVNLNLEALEAELRLPPITCVSGHIHELRLSVPWTKITSEPIRVYINTLEIVLKLRGKQTCDISPKCSSTSLSSILEKMKSTEEETGYMKNLAKKVLQNVEIVFENVVLKYVEDDLVLSLNIRKVVSQCVNGNWEPAFIELSPPSYFLRKLWTCSDLTICLDSTNNVGKIEIYMEPLLYKCSFEVRVLYQYHGHHAQIPYFGRYDIKVTSMKFSVIQSQITLLTRLYYLVKLLLFVDTGKRSTGLSTTASADEVSQESLGTSNESMLGWASWAISLVPAIPEAIFGPSDESCAIPMSDFAVPIAHYALFIENAAIDFKLIETVSDKRYYRKVPKIKYTNFMNCEIQGTAVDLIFHGLDVNLKMGVSEVVVTGAGSCPCGMDDSARPTTRNMSCENDLSTFLRIGEPNENYADESMFGSKYESMGDVRPSFEYHFKLEGHFEAYSDEEMLKRTPGVALEFLELDPTPLRLIEDEDESYDQVPEPKTPCSLCRVVTGKTHVKVCSGSIHRGKLIAHYIDKHNMETYYGYLHDLVFPKTKVFDEIMETLDGRSLFTFKCSIRDPLIEVVAADHPDYDSLSHIRAFHKRRNCTTLGPLTHYHENWPKLLLRCDQVNLHYSEPTLKFMRLVEGFVGSFTDHPDVLSDYASKLDISVDSLTAKLVSGNISASLIEPCTFGIRYNEHFKPSIQCSDYEPIQTIGIHIDSFSLQVSNPNLHVSHVILWSMFEENVSSILLYTTLLNDVPHYFEKGDFNFNLTNANLTYSRTNITTSFRAVLKSVTASITLPEFTQAAPLMEMHNVNESDKEASQNVFEGLLQYPTKMLEGDMSEEDALHPLWTPICAIYVGRCSIHLAQCVATWLAYRPGPQKPDINPDCCRLQPISPLGKSIYGFTSTEYERDDQDSHSSTSMGSQSLTGIKELYRRNQPSTHRTDMSSNLSFKSAPEEYSAELSDSQQIRLSAELDENMDIFHSHVNAIPWELFLVKYLEMIKIAFLRFEVESVKLYFPVEHLNNSNLTSGSVVTDYFVFEAPYILAQPEAPSAASWFDKRFFHSTKPVEVKGKKDLFPLKTVISDLHAYSLHGLPEKLIFLPALCLRLTLTLADRLIDKVPAISVFIHCDIPPVKAVLTTIQVQYLVQLLEKLIETCSILEMFSEVSFLLRVDPSWRKIPSTTKTAPDNNDNMSTEATEVIEPKVLPASHLRSEQCSQSSISVFESIPPSTTFDREGSEMKLIKSESVVEKPKEKLKTPTFWVQLTMSQFQLILRNCDTPLTADVTNQLVLEIEDIASSLDIQMVYRKFTLKLGSLSLRCYERNDTGTWDFGKHGGVIISSGDEITHDIEILGSPSVTEYTPVDNDLNQTASGSKKHGFLNLTFTRVLARNYHMKSDVSSTTAKWNAIIKKLYNNVSTKYEDRRLDEIDLKLSSLDMMFCPEALLPFRVMLHHIVYTLGSSSETPVKCVPAGNFVTRVSSVSNNTLPMIYFETDMIRLFMQCKNERSTLAGHDLVLFQTASICLVSHADNPLIRSPLKTDLYQLAEKASILTIPGSPIEDRQYQLDIRDFSIATCNSTDLEKNSRKKSNHRSSIILRAMGENPAFEWNIKQDQVAQIEDVEAHILLERTELTAVFAPPIVYKSGPSVYGNHLIAGQMFEMNIPSTISIGCSITQFSCLDSLSNDCSDFWKEVRNSASEMQQPQPKDSDTNTTFLLPPTSLKPPRVGSDSGFDSYVCLEQVPTDVIITCSSIECKLYEYQLKAEDSSNPKPTNLNKYLIKPLLYVSLSQPHLIAHISGVKQNLEITSYGVYFGLGCNSSTSSTLILPQVEDYSLKPLHSIEGKKNPKTGMANAFFTLKLNDFSQSTCKASMELFRPIQIVLSKELLAGIHHITDLIRTQTRPEQLNVENPIVYAGQHRLSDLAALIIKSNQIIVTFTVLAEGTSKAQLSFAVADMNLSFTSKTNRTFGHFPFFAAANGSVNGIMITSKLHDRKEIILNPWNLHVDSSIQLCSWNAMPHGNVSVSADPISILFGPQNMLAVLQVYNELQQWLTMGEDQVSSSEHISHTLVLPGSQTFFDDLRTGIFNYVFSESSLLPGVYQICFSHVQQAITWRYPQPRYLSEVVVLPAPIISASVRGDQYTSVECSLMYWVEALTEFKELTTFALSENSVTHLNLPSKENVHEFVSDIWRVKLVNYFDEGESELDGIRPEILANCLNITSVYNPLLIEDLKVNVELAGVTVHLVNHPPQVERLSEKMLARFYYNPPTQKLQEFATLELSSTNLNWHQWSDRSKFSFISYLQLSVVDFAFLKDFSVVEPFNFQFKAAWTNECLSDVDLLTKPIICKFGGSALHTLVSSFVEWKQYLCAQSLQHEISHRTNVFFGHTLICNDTSSTFNILQDGTDTYFSLLARQCQDFHWTSPKSKPQCRIRLQGESCWSQPFGLSNKTRFVRDAGNNLPVFVNISHLSGLQQMVTISGGLIVANALQESIDVSIVLKNGNELNHSIVERSYGPSHVMSIEEIKCFRFRLTAPNEDYSQWAMDVQVEDMRKSSNNAVPIRLQSTEAKSTGPIYYNVWCSLVEEVFDKSLRHLMVICPFFRVKSSLAVPTLTCISTGKNEIESSSTLRGKGSEMQIDFVGSSEATLHLTFQHGTIEKNSRSQPTIPLNPHGPALEKGIPLRPIDEILDLIVHNEQEQVWPFIREDIPFARWEQIETRPVTDVHVEFTPWIEGLPSVLIDAKPWALFVNITGETILFSESTLGEEVFEIPNAFVFTPSKIKEFFKLGIQYKDISYWTANLEFTEQKSRTNIHYVNLDNRIPIDCYSRLEVVGGKETWYITLEARIHKGMLILSMRPTYSIQNRTEVAMNIKFLSLCPVIIPSENELKLEHGLIKLDADLVGASTSTTEPLIMVHQISERPSDETEIKYLAIGHENGPFWFVQLANFELMFSNMSVSEVIPGHRIAFSLPSCQPFRTQGSAEKLVHVTYPVTLSWVCKYGQVWMSISKDSAPPLVLTNETNEPFVVAETNGRSDTPYKDNYHFRQYLTLSPLSIGHCSLSSANTKFPDVNKLDTEVSILLAKHRGVSPGANQMTSVYYEPSQLEWSSEIALDKISGTHSFRIGGYTKAEHYQLRVERLGLSYFVYIRNISTTEVSAKDIRGRIAEASSSSPMLTSISSKLNMISAERSKSTPVCGQVTSPYLTILNSLEEDAAPDVNALDIDSSCDPTMRPFPLIRVHVPLFRLILTDDRTYFKERREILGFTFQDVCIDLTPETDPTQLQILRNKPQENIVINLRLGDFQLDNALYEEKKFDFPVIIKRVQDYQPSVVRPVISLETVDTLFQAISEEKNFLVEFTALIGLHSPTERSLQKVWVELRPIALYLEDSFYYFLQPTVNELISVVDDRLNLLKSKQTREVGSDSNVQIPSTASSKMDTNTTLMPPAPPGTLADVTEASSCVVYMDPASVPNISLASAICEEFEEKIKRDNRYGSETSLYTDSERLEVPVEIMSIINEFAEPIRMQHLIINPAVMFITVRLSRRFYLAMDHSPLEFSRFEARSIVTTNLALGHALSSHYVQGALFTSTNPVKLLGSLELLGSPGGLARSVSIGIKDFVVYPVKGLFEGPAGFLTGITHGCSSLVTNVGSGTITSVRNLAWSVSRNLDRMTSSEIEQLQHEEDRRAPIDGVSDGIIHGLTGFGIRLLGAIGGLAQHPIDSVIDSGASPIRLLAGFGRGLLGVITKPIGGAVELVAMTGQGILTGAGWTPRLQRKHSRVSESIDSSNNSLMRYHWMLRHEEEDHRMLLIFDASLCTSATESIPVSILLTNENIYVVNTLLDEIDRKIKVSSITIEPSNDSTKLSLKQAPERKPKATSLAQERLMDFVKGCAIGSQPGQQENGNMEEETDKSFCLNLYVDPNTKSEFITLFKQCQEQQKGTIFPLL